MEIGRALRDAARVLESISVNARFDAELLMARALGVSRSDMLLHHLSDPVPDVFAALLARRASHEPMGYILGEESFFGLAFKVGPDVLIPRPDSEVLVEQALDCGRDARCVLDCGTGSGALLLSVLFHLKTARGVGIDRSEKALAIAKENALTLGLADRAALVRADWDEPGWSDALGGPFDLVLANPPYVEADAQLEPSVRDFEPAGALFAGHEGLDAYRRLLPQIPGLLAPDGHALIEIGASQAAPVSELARGCGLTVQQLHRDLADRPRVVQMSARR
ncbi:MAG: peptide chain release factor N(5)-glutamine methyltransferase [Sphingomonadaceae bacterium]|nr:peptide chain release factor N(5)-glutamine methyltransferase [Sphingomonadaceae bacterium]